MKTVTAVKKIIIVDDHPLIRRAMRQLFESEKHLHVSAEADRIDSALMEIRRHPPDIVIADIGLPDGNGYDLIKRLHAQLPGLPILVCSMHGERFFAERALQAGARGYVSKLEAPEHLVEAVKTILAGKTFVGPALATEVREYLSADGANCPRSPMETLTNRELEIFQQIGAGKSTAEIAGRLNVSVKTVETHRLHIKEKLKITSATELTRYAVHWATQDLL